MQKVLNSTFGKYGGAGLAKTDQENSNLTDLLDVGLTLLWKKKTQTTGH